MYNVGASNSEPEKNCYFQSYLGTTEAIYIYSPNILFMEMLNDDSLEDINSDYVLQQVNRFTSIPMYKMTNLGEDL